MKNHDDEASSLSEQFQKNLQNINKTLDRIPPLKHPQPSSADEGAEGDGKRRQLFSRGISLSSIKKASKFWYYRSVVFMGLSRFIFRSS